MWRIEIGINKMKSNEANERKKDKDMNKIKHWNKTEENDNDENTDNVKENLLYHKGAIFEESSMKK